MVTTRSLLRCAAALVFIALGGALFGTGIQGMNALMTLASLQQIYEQTAPPMNGVIFGQYNNLGIFSQAGIIGYLRPDVDQSSIWALVSTGAVAIITGFIVLMDGVFVHPTPKGHGKLYKAWMGAAGTVAILIGLIAFLFSFISTYTARGHMAFNAKQQVFLGFRTEDITFDPTGYVNQEEYSCFVGGYSNPGGNSTARGTVQWEPFVYSCRQFMAARWLSIPFLLAALWLAAQEFHFLSRDKTTANGDTSSDDFAKEKDHTAHESAPAATTTTAPTVDVHVPTTSTTGQAL